MNTSIISHRMFVAALSNDTGVPDKHSRAARAAVAAKGDDKPVTKQLTLEQLAATAAQYWPDFPFGATLEQHAE